METRQYRLTRHPAGWQVIVTYGLLDTALLGAGRVWRLQSEARKAAREHAERAGVKPIILT